MPGRVLGAMTSQSCGETIGFPYIATTVTQAVFVATIQCVVTSIVLRIRVGSTSGTATFYKAPSGTAAASGTAITGSIDLSTTPAADTTIVVPLLAGPGLTFNPGDSIAVVIAGTMTSGVGLLQVFLEPTF
jgi:uncharacterized membrane protein